MKLLPCRPRKGPRCSTSHAWFGGVPALAGRYQDRYKCSRCGNVTELTAVEFNGLPSLGVDDVRSRAEKDRAWVPVLKMFRRDFEGMGLAPEQADDLLRAGFRATTELEGRTEQ